MKRFLLVLFVLPLFARAQTNSLRPAIKDARVRVTEATEALNQLRDEVAEERAPLADRLETLRREVEEKRSEIKRIRAARSQNASEAEALTREVGRMKEAHAFKVALFEEYR
ncbi:MAG: hypothetical protein AAF492_06090, partial [Verrucomicrobiota bacterium]